jgi:hypothetical protein
MVHAALLLLMLEAVTKDLVFTISLKRSTQNLQLSTSWAGRLHHLLRLERTRVAGGLTSAFDPTLSIFAVLVAAAISGKVEVRRGRSLVYSE